MASDSRTFLAMCLAGDGDLNDIHEFIVEWHCGVARIPLHEYPGIDLEEYGAWVEDDDAPERTSDSHRS